MAPTYDVVVIGAGPAGSTAAHYLAQAGKNVLLLDKEDFPRDKTCGDGLTPRALRTLANMGILREVEQAGFRVNGLKMFAQSGATISAPIPAHQDFPANLVIVPRMKLDDILRQRAIRSGANFESPVRVLAIQNETGHLTLKTERNGQQGEYKARVAILAVGANTRLLSDLGILKRAPKPIIAIRAYYKNMRDLDDSIQIHFERVPMPGYGWVFPISKNSANVGIGTWRNPEKHSSLRAAMQAFLQSPRMQTMLAGAEQVGVVKSYPLRTDFAMSPTFGERALLVGETAGLVNPLTGEGIDFALETGRVAAEFLASAFAANNFTQEFFQQYDQLLRREYQSTFRILSLLRRLYVNPWAMDRMLKLCSKNPAVRDTAIGVILSQQHPLQLIRLGLLRELVLGF